MPQAVTQDQPLHTLREAAAKLGVSYATIRRYTAAGDLTVVRINSRNVKVKPADLQAFIDSRVELARSA